MQRSPSSGAAHLVLVRPMASDTTSPPDRGIVAHPPPEHVRISRMRQRVGLRCSVVGVAAVLLGAFWASAAAWLFPAGGVLMIASLFLLGPYCPIFQQRPKRHDPYKIESHKQVLPIARANRWLSRCAHLDFMKQFSMLCKLAAASGGSAPSR